MKIQIIAIVLLISLFIVGCSSSVEETVETTKDIVEDSADSDNSDTSTESAVDDTEFLTEEDEDLGDLI